MNELSTRLRTAVDFLKKTGAFKTDRELAMILGFPAATISMTTTGKRAPSWDLLLTFCERFPINFEWLRTGVGPIIRGETWKDREQALLRRIEELTAKAEELEKKVDKLTAALGE